MPAAQPLLYTEFADWWPIFSSPFDYAEEASIFTRAIHSALPNARTMLELGSGGGNNASHLKKHFEMTLVDLSPAMVETSRRLNPELPHFTGDMRSVRLGNSYDVVFIHDAIMYLTEQEDLRQAALTAYAHTRPGGVALFVPDHVRETFRPGTDHGGHDGEEIGEAYAGRSVRYLEWTFDPDPTDTSYIADYVYVLREGTEISRCVHDRHICGIFPRATWTGILEEAGFSVQVLPFEHSEVTPGQVEMFLGTKGDELLKA